MRAFVAAVLGLATALAGCLGDASEPPATPPGDAPPPDVQQPPPEELEPTTVDPEVQHFQGSIAGFRSPDPVGLYLRTPGSDGENRFDFDLPAGALAVVIEAAWNGSDALDLLVEPPADACTSDDPAGLTGSCPEVPSDRDGQSVARVVLADPALLNLTGTWSFSLWARQSANPVEFTAAVSVFLAAPPEEGYSTYVPSA